MDWAIAQVDKEHRWLPVLAPQLPLEIPTPVAKGEPGEGYPWKWSVYRWIAGETATADRLDDVRQAAIDLAVFVKALRAIDATDGPRRRRTTSVAASRWRSEMSRHDRRLCS